MAEAIRQESPLVQCKQVAHSNSHRRDAGVLLAERAFCGHINLRGNPEDADFLQGVEKAAGFELPLEPNSVIAGENYSALWLGPNEWLLVTQAGQEDEVIPRLREALANQFVAVTDVSSGQTIIALSGDRCRDVLAKGCTLDLHPHSFGPGQCAQTLVAKSGALLWPRSAAAIDIIVRRSFADYLWRWLEDAAQEYGFAVID